jgi:hypothetical protein
MHKLIEKKENDYHFILVHKEPIYHNQREAKD